MTCDYKKLRANLPGILFDKRVLRLEIAIAMGDCSEQPYFETMEKEGHLLSREVTSPCWIYADHPKRLYPVTAINTVEVRMRRRTMVSQQSLKCVERRLNNHSDGGRFKGYGWPTLLEPISPLENATDSRQVIKMTICPSCRSVHESGGRCIFPRQNQLSP